MNGDDSYETSSGLMYAISGIALVAVGTVLLENLALMTAVGVAVIATGVYLLVVGAVARGVQLARLAAPGTRSGASTGQD